MIIISHRGNLNGIDPERENNPYFIDDCISKGFDVEIDLRIKENKLFLGHDFAQYEVDIDWLLERKKNLWIHVKEYAALNLIMPYRNELTFFCHEKDKFTLLSNGKIWSHDLENEMNDDCVVPLLSLKEVLEYEHKHFYAVCTDYVYESENKFKLNK
jgi:hypothetical protein